MSTDASHRHRYDSGVVDKFVWTKRLFKQFLDTNLISHVDEHSE